MIGVRCMSMLSAFLLLLAMPGCEQRWYLAKTPNLYHDPKSAEIFHALEPAQRTPDINILYVTDRKIETKLSTPEIPHYGYNRSRDLAWGEATIDLSPHPTFEKLVADTTGPTRSQRYWMHTKRVTELGRVTSLVDRLTIVDNRLGFTPKAQEQIDAERVAFQAEITRRLAQSKTKDVYLYVHGFNNGFEDSTWRTAELYHFLGRQGVAVAYSWPAGAPGIFAYFRDRESGEFTAFHLKYVIDAIAHTAAVEHVHIVSHSRGTDVLLTALRELNLQYEGAKIDTQKELKLETVILASPDIDTQVFTQRCIAERLLDATRQFVIYYSPNDNPLAWANWLFSGEARLGRLSVKSFPDRMRRELIGYKRVQFIDCNVTGYNNSHDYEFGHPAVLSDMVLLLKYHDLPGKENGRPLATPIEGLWQINNDYPNVEASR